jgi:hypothetical protein
MESGSNNHYFLSPNSGYAYRLDLETLTTEKLFKAIHEIIHKPQYRREAK